LVHPVVLAAVHGEVGAAQERLRRRAVIRKPGDADGGADPELRVLVCDRGRDGLDNLLGEAPQLALRAVREEHGELVAAEARRRAAGRRERS
jgi:hypothetical protein